MKPTWIVTVEVTFAVEANHFEDAQDKAHDHIAWKGLNNENIERVSVELWEEVPA